MRKTFAARIAGGALAVVMASSLFFLSRAWAAFISESMEICLGRKYHQEMMAKYGGEWMNTQLKSYVEEVGRRVTSVSERSGLPYSFTLLNTDAFAAMSLPGGFIYVSRGALMNINNEAQLAALLGHETAHIAKKHCVALVEQQMSIDMILSVVGWIASQQSSDDRKTIESITQTGTTMMKLAQLGYGREKELEADKGGADYAAHAGYDPGGALQLLYILRSIEGNRSVGGISEIFQTHPSTDTRIEKLKEYLSQQAYEIPPEVAEKDRYYKETYLPNIEAPVKNSDAFYYYDLGKRFEKRRVYDIALVEYYMALKNDPNMAEAYDAVGGLALNQGSYEAAIENFTKAIQCEQKAQYYNDLGSAYYFMGRYQDAIQYIGRAIELEPDYPIANANMAENYRCLGDLVRATGFAEKAVRLSPENYFARAVLATVYEQRNWRADAIRQYQVLLGSQEYRKMASQRLAVLGG